MLLTTPIKIQKTKDELTDKPAQDLKLITFLNGKNREEIEELKISDKTEAILKIKKVFTKNSLRNNLKEKCETMNLSITRFMVKYTNPRQKGLPDIHVLNAKLIP